MEKEIIISEYIRYTKQSAQRKCLVKDHLYEEVWNYVTTGEKTAKLQHLIDVHKYRKKMECWCRS